jgi:ribosome maturation factor RimP
MGEAAEKGWSSLERGSESIVDRLQRVISPILWTLGLELVEVLCVGQGPRSLVRVSIDKPGGVTIADCEKAHRALGPALDVADPFPHAYTLEVSSPGLDRPLRLAQDYQRVIGKEINLKLRQPRDGQWRVTGRLAEVNEPVVVLEISAGTSGPQLLRVEREQIAEARLVVRI